MRITKLRIENFRNISLAECENPPDFMVICGGNGCGKSAFLQALMTVKEHAGSYGAFEYDQRAVSADATKATISMTLAFSEADREFVSTKPWGGPCPAQDEIVVEIEKGGQGRATKRSGPVHNLLGWYSRQYLNPPGFFDFIEAYRLSPKKQLSAWNAEYLSDERAKQTLGAQGSQKFQFTKEYLASLVMGDLQDMQRSHHDGNLLFPDSLKPIRDFFNQFFAPMQFREVRIDTSPFKYIIDTPRGEIDIDDLSGGEKEVLNIFIRFHQLKPKGSIILFDEADAHLHPDLERRYLEVLRKLGEGNQIWLTTHSPEMMIAAGAGSLYTIMKQPPFPGGNQFVRVSENEMLHEVLSEIMGSRGLVSFNQRIVFIEGEESSADREIYERLYPPGVYNVSFIPAGNSATVRKTAERVNQLLASSVAFQQYYSIVDGDIERSIPAMPSSTSTGTRLFQLPVYHVENFLLDAVVILEVVRAMLGERCPYKSESDVEAALRNAVVGEQHLRSLAGALLDAQIAKLANEARDAVFKNRVVSDLAASRPTFETAMADARKSMEDALTDGTWKRKCKGREVLRAFCGVHQLNYEHFRNVLIAQMKLPPPGLAEIMDQILPKSK
jgi:predicted ATPase